MGIILKRKRESTRKDFDVAPYAGEGLFQYGPEERKEREPGFRKRWEAYEQAIRDNQTNNIMRVLQDLAIETNPVNPEPDVIRDTYEDPIEKMQAIAKSAAKKSKKK